VHYAYQAGYDPRGMVTLFQDLLQERSRRPTRVEQFFANHPLTEDRIRTVQAEASQLPRKASLTHDTRNYQNFRSDFR
jgi:predicted Zn-dependent protease